MVIDASAIFEVLTRANPRAIEKLAREPLQAPHLIDVEVLHALRRHERLGNLDPHRAREALQAFAQVPLIRFAHGPLLARAWELRANLTAYDAIYVALAEGLGVSLLTADAKLKAAPGHRAKIERI